jgi:uncharacterized GH25 family protein
MIRQKLAVLFAAIAVSSVFSQAFGHELFLQSARSPVPANSDEELRLVNGAFDKSENSIARDRMRNVSIVANGRTTSPPATAWYDDKVSSWLKYRTGEPGTYVIGVSTLPKVLEQTSAEFMDYLKHDGVPDTLAAFEKLSPRPEKVRERYLKHVRAIVQAGDKTSDDYSKPLGYPVEILLEKNPAAAKQGDRMSFRVLFGGKPVANQLVQVSHRGFHGHDASGKHMNAYTLRTDKEGRASFELNRKSLWYISLIHMRKVDQADADYESNWATVTFHVKS